MRSEVSEVSVVEGGVPLVYTFGDLMRYHGPSAPGGVAHAFKVLERALPLLDEGTRSSVVRWRSPRRTADRACGTRSRW